MSKQDRIKKRIFHAMVEDNLELMHGHPKGYIRKRRSRNLGRIKRGLVLAFSGALMTIAVTAWQDLGASASANGAASPAAVAPEGVKQLRANQIETIELQATGADRVRGLAKLLAERQPQDLLNDVIPLAVKTIAIDPGHGGIDGGTSLGYGLVEKDLTLDIAYRLGKLLNGAGFATVHTRTDDIDVSLKQRATIANQEHADVFISIHVNWIPRREARGVETYYLGQTDDPFVRKLAAAENRDSDFSLADYRNLLQGILDQVRQEESKVLAGSVQRSLYRTLRADNPRIENRGVMTAPFVVLTATEMPAILAEVACLSNDREARLLAMPHYRQKIAEALFFGLTSYCRRVEHTETLRKEKQP
jgi:N-acetylmuramoyl-L-alanine amidase